MTNVPPGSDLVPGDRSQVREGLSERPRHETRWTVLRYALEGWGQTLRLCLVLVLVLVITIVVAGHVWL